ncbi:MAG: hypothetical protein ABFD49_06700 [Armatimonadota bacterium]|nr:hypothetical protein [bacterium]
MQIYYLIGIIIIGYGLMIVSKGHAVKSKPRMLLGLAVVPVGIAQFFRGIPWLATALIVLGVILFVSSLLMLKKEAGGRR